jgi:uncharacterized membrane protein
VTEDEVRLTYAASTDTDAEPNKGRPDPKPTITRPDPSAFHTAMAHLYRGEMHRMTVWRQRLDVTTNWAILMTGGMTTFALGSPSVPHFVLLLGFALIAVSLFIESRRYQRLHHSRWRLHVMEACYFASMLEGKADCDDAAWRSTIAHDLREPRMFVSWLTAMKVRLRRNYLLLIVFITAVWVTKLFIHPHDAAHLGEFWDRLAVGGIVPSWIVAASAGMFLVSCSVLAATARSAESIEEQATIADLRARVSLTDH